MGPDEALYDNKTYSPGDAWTHPQFATMAVVPPKIIETRNSGQNTAPSYFENRAFRGITPTVTVALSGGAGVLEGSLNGGTTWETLKTYTGPTSDNFDYSQLFMLRLRMTSGSNVNVSLTQSL